VDRRFNLRKRVRNGMISLTDFEPQQKMKLQGVKEAAGYSVGGVRKNPGPPLWLQIVKLVLSCVCGGQRPMPT
jgi:hypothetical protein